MDTAQPAPDAQHAMDLEKELTCSICTDLLYQPLTLLDCLHTFCGACVKEWFGWQAQAAETRPTPPPPGAAIFTCPSCRDAVRSTKHNATVATLLDMLLAAQPDKRRPADERAAMDAKYRPGDRVFPAVHLPKRTPEQVRLDEAERRLIDEVRDISRQEAVARAVGDAAGGGSAARIVGHQSSLRSLLSTGGGDGAVAAAGAAAVQSAAAELDIAREIEAFARQIQEEGLLDGLDLDNIDLTNDDELSRRIAEAYQRRQRGRARHARSSGGGGGGGGGSTASSARNHHHRTSSAVSHTSHASHNSQASTGGPQASPAPHERSSRSDRPSSGSALAVGSAASAAAAGRPPSSSSRTSSHHRSHSQSSYRPHASSMGSPSPATLAVPAHHGRPVSSSGHLEVRDDAAWRQQPHRDHQHQHHHHHERRRTASESRSTSLPLSSSSASSLLLSPEASRQATTRSQTDLPLRLAELPGSSVATPPSSPPTAAHTNPSPSPTTASFQARAQALGLQPSSSTSSPPARSPPPPPQPSQPVVAAQLALSPVAADAPPHEVPPPLSPPLSPPAAHERQTSRTRPLRPPPAPPVFAEPDIACARCGRTHIEYEVHYNCATCHDGRWDICLACYRAGKGCQHWFGFGYAAWQRWERQAKSQPGLPAPHMLTANRYRRPGSASIRSGSSSSRLDAHDPLDRLESGVFCARCSAWANAGYWRCDVCNDGDWGFCSACVDAGYACTHPLLPLAHQPPSTSDDDDSGGGGAGAARSPRIGPFRVLDITTTCDLCRQAIPARHARFHCYGCARAAAKSTKAVGSGNSNSGNGNSGDICETCYLGLAASPPDTPVVAPENGPRGWRRCPSQGHRMVVVAFREDDGGGGLLRRVVVEDLVGGVRLESEPRRRATEAAAGGAPADGTTPGVDAETWYIWYADRRLYEWPVSRSVSDSITAYAGAAAAAAGPLPPLPPSGGIGRRAVALRWPYFPEPNASDAADAADAADDELSFPSRAEIREVEDVNGAWFHGVYMGRAGLFPSDYVTLLDA